MKDPIQLPDGALAPIDAVAVALAQQQAGIGRGKKPEDTYNLPSHSLDPFDQDHGDGASGSSPSGSGGLDGGDGTFK